MPTASAISPPNRICGPGESRLPYDIGIVGGEVALPEGARRCDVAIRDGKIAAITEALELDECRKVVDAKSTVVLPGIIDAHNHPYYDDDIVEFATSAAYGGITTMMSFAGTHMGHATSPQRAVEVVADFITRANGRVPLDYGVHAIVGPGDEPESTVEALAELGVRSVKMFLAFPGVRMLDDASVLAFMQAAARRDMLCMVHCENGPATRLLEEQAVAAGRTSPSDYSSSRPDGLEAESVYRALALAEIAGVACYIVHVSCARSLDVIATFRNRGNIPIYVETCPHYLLLTEDDLDRVGGLAKISPPLRARADAEALWQAVADGVVDIIASDTSGQRREPKEVDDIFAAPYGIPGVEQMLPLIWHEAVNVRRLGAEVVADRMSARPAQIFDLPGKGELRVGADADLVVLDPERTWTISANDQHGNSDYSLYEGREVRGRAVLSLRRGAVLLDGETLSSNAEPGRYLAR
jgi:dihydropyrimidinase